MPARPTHQLLRRHLQIGKVTLSARSDPQCYSSLSWLEFQIVDDQAGLLRSVHVEPRFAAFHLNSVLGPNTGLQINIRLVLFRRLLAQPGEVEIRVRTVLGGVIPPDLVVGSAVGWPQIDVLVSSIGLEAKGDANEPTRATARASSRLASQ